MRKCAECPAPAEPRRARCETCARHHSEKAFEARRPKKPKAPNVAKRDEPTYARFVTYLSDVGVLEGIRAICLRHHVTLRDGYFDVYGPSARRARVESWLWMRESLQKSNGEIGRIWDRDPVTIANQLKKLFEIAKDLPPPSSTRVDDLPPRKVIDLAVRKLHRQGKA